MDYLENEEEIEVVNEITNTMKRKRGRKALSGKSTVHYIRVKDRHEKTMNALFNIYKVKNLNDFFEKFLSNASRKLNEDMVSDLLLKE